MTWGWQLYFPSEVVLWIIAVKNPSLSAGFELTNLGSNGKQFMFSVQETVYANYRP
jgi:hypothetical protein